MVREDCITLQKKTNNNNDFQHRPLNGYLNFAKPTVFTTVLLTTIEKAVLFVLTYKV